MAIPAVSLSALPDRAPASSQAEAQGEAARRAFLPVPLRIPAAGGAEFSLGGRARLSLEDLQAKAGALLNLNRPPTLSDFKLAVQGFVAAFNSLSRTLSAARSDADAAEMAATLREAARGEEGALAALRKAGIAPTDDGMLAVEESRLETAVRQEPGSVMPALNGLFARVENAAARLLGGGEQADDPNAATAQTRDAGRQDARQRLAAQLAGADSHAARHAVATYFSVAAL